MAHINELRLIGELTPELYQSFSEEFDEALLDEPLYIELNSEGGDVHVALAITSKIRRWPGKVHITAYGNVASAAVLILASGTNRSMAKEAWVMVHEDGCEFEGRVTKLERHAKHQRRMEDQWNALLAERTKASAEVWAQLHKESTYLNPEQCLELGLIDEIV